MSRFNLSTGDDDPEAYFPLVAVSSCRAASVRTEAIS